MSAEVNLHPSTGAGEDVAAFRAAAAAQLAQSALVQLPGAFAEHVSTGDEHRHRADAPPPWAVVGLLEFDTPALMVGKESDSYKTTLGLDLGVAIVSGQEWLGFEVVPRPRQRILYVMGEGRPRHAVRCIRRLAVGRGLNPNQIDRHFVIHYGPVGFVPLGELRENELPDEALEALDEVGPGVFGLVIVDSLSHCLIGDENTARDARRFTSAIDTLAATLLCPVVALHHTSRAANQGRARSARGSTALEAGVRAVLRCDASGEWPVLSASKLNDHPPPEPRGYGLIDTENGGLNFQVLAPNPPQPRGDNRGRPGRPIVRPDEVAAVLQQHAPSALSLSKIRSAISVARGGKPGSKMNQEATQAAVDQLITEGKVTKVEVTASRRSFPGYRWGDDSSVAEAEHIDVTGADVEVAKLFGRGD